MLARLVLPWLANALECVVRSKHHNNLMKIGVQCYLVVTTIPVPNLDLGIR